MSEKPKKEKGESEEDYENRLELWYDETGKILYLIETETALDAYKELSDAVFNWDNLAEFVTNDGSIMKLRKHKESEPQWQIMTVDLKDIARAMLEKMG